MRALVMGGTEFISLHLVQSLLARKAMKSPSSTAGGAASASRLAYRPSPAIARITPACASGSKGERFDGVFDVTYAPTLGEDVTALLDALPGQPHAIFVSTARVYDHALPIPYSEDTPRGFYWGDYARHKIAGEDVLFERHRAARGSPSRSSGRPTSWARSTRGTTRRSSWIASGAAGPC